MRFIPELVFKADTSLAYGARINKILSDINRTEEKGEQDD